VSLSEGLPPEEGIPRPGRNLLLRGLIGGLIIIGLTSAAVATAALLQVGDLVTRLRSGAANLSSEGITKAEAGAPQTILVLGSDRRFSDLKKNNKLLRRNAPARSDTMMLMRLDPDQAATSILSLPRDLKVRIPGFGTDKLNASYSYGGPTLTVRTIKDYTGLTINHVVNVNFGGFREVVNAIGCVYVDVDRRYYHSNAGLAIGQRYAEINIPSGYQKLCGTDALDYVRYRHNDSDIVRAARQQAFLRQAKDQINSGSLIDNRDKLVGIFGRSTQTDAALESTVGLLRVLKLALFSAGHPVRQIQFPARYDQERLPGGAVIDYVTASRTQVRRTIEEFLHPAAQVSRAKKPQLTPSVGKKSRKRVRRSPSPSEVPGLLNGQRAGEDLVANVVANKRLGLPLYFPKYVTSSSRYDNPGIRAYTLHDRAAKLRHAYRLVLSANPVEGQYWGIQGTDWPSPPILQGTHSLLTRHGRRLGVYKDGSRVHLVSWRRGKGVYWVVNTLSDALTNAQMIEIASTLTRTFA